jgi:UDP-sulfoquinovose synthase
MGEYGTPNTDIPEGFFEFEYKGRSDTRLFPREAGSLYHTTKILDTDLLWFYCRMKGLRVTDLMQGPVYGVTTPHLEATGLETHFNYDGVFGTVLNRFCVQALADEPLTVYGGGGQTRGYIDLRDTMRCVELAVENPVEVGELRVLNQYAEEYSVLELAGLVIEAASRVGIEARVESIDNPRIELEDHHYASENTKLRALGFEPRTLDAGTIAAMLEQLEPHAPRIQREQLLPTVRW